MIPPEQNSEFVAAMEDVLEIYRLPYDPDRPVVCMDEQPIQLIGETRVPVPMKSGHAARVDFEYRRMGTANNFMFTEALGGWRKVNVRERKTKLDWANEIKMLLDNDYPNAEKVILVCDNLNTHTPGALYEAFEPAEARRLLDRLDIRHTPKHGSWLNIAEIELSVLTNQCLGRRIETVEKLRREVGAWARSRTEGQKSVEWHMTTEDARIKLKRLYPQFKG